MTRLALDADEVLTTTRAVRKRLDFDRPVPLAVLEECLQIALQAPSGSNSQGWHFVLVTDDQKRAAIAGWYQKAFAAYENSPASPVNQHAENPGMQATQARVLDSAQYLAANLARAPAMLIPCFMGRTDSPDTPYAMQAGMFASIIPATWSFMLAARERGLGTCWTTLHLNYEREVAAILGIPEQVSQAALIPIAYTRGTDFKAAPRKPLGEALHLDSW